MTRDRAVSLHVIHNEDAALADRLRSIGGPRELAQLMRASARLRAYAVMLAKQPGWRARNLRQNEAFWRLVDDVRLDLRIAVDLPVGFREPKNEGEALAFMRAPSFCKSHHHAQLRTFEKRSGTDPRVLVSVERAIADAEKLGVPLWPSSFQTDCGERSAVVQADEDGRPREWLVGVGRSVQFGHGLHRNMPVACWDAVGGIVMRASLATGYPLVPVDPVPGEFELAPDCRELELVDVRIVPRRSPGEAGAEAEALFRFYSGKADDVPWETAALHGELSADGDGQPETDDG